MKTKSHCDIFKQMQRIEKLFYSIVKWWDVENYPYMGQMNLAQAIAEDYHNNIHRHLGGDYDDDDAAEFNRRYYIQVPKEVYTSHHSEYTKYLINKQRRYEKTI